MGFLLQRGLRSSFVRRRSSAWRAIALDEIALTANAIDAIAIG
jgi:hypothetical protein